MSRIDITIYHKRDRRPLRTTGFFKDWSLYAVFELLSPTNQKLIHELGTGF